MNARFQFLSAIFRLASVNHHRTSRMGPRVTVEAVRRGCARQLMRDRPTREAMREPEPMPGWQIPGLPLMLDQPTQVRPMLESPAMQASRMRGKERGPTAVPPSLTLGQDLR